MTGPSSAPSVFFLFHRSRCVAFRVLWAWFVSGEWAKETKQALTRLATHQNDRYSDMACLASHLPQAFPDLGAGREMSCMWLCGDR